MHRGSLLSVAAAALLAASSVSCGGDDSDGAGTPTAAASGDELLSDSWMHLVASDPAAHLGAFEGATGEAWLSFYHNDLRRTADRFSPACMPSEAALGERAAAGYPCIGLARTHIELADLYARAAEVDRVAWRQFHKHRGEHAEEVLPSVHADFFGGLVLLHSGDSEGGTERLAAYGAAEGANPTLVALGSTISEGLVNGDPLVMRIWGGASADAPADHPGLGDLPTSSEVAPYLARLAFVTAVARGDIDGATGLLRAIVPRAADLEERLEQEGGEAPAVDPVIRHHDPSYLYALARYHALQAIRASGGASDLQVLTAQAQALMGVAPDLPSSAPSLNDGLALVVFSSHPNPADLLAAEVARPNAISTIRRLSAARPVLGSAPTADLADLDPFIDGSNSVTIRLGELLNASGDQGGNLDADMGLSERFRSHLLRERAVQFRHSFAVALDETEGADMAGPGVAVRSMLELAFDKNPSPPNNELKQARISYLNDPPLLLMLARAELDTRRAGEANDYVRPLTTLFPELISVRDALTILDTAWNPPREGGGVKQGN
ncbi:MAG: hypothetical protein GY898_18030 [Proteobacteria bacterium]|nr:hypothetical protein [Pseudomonadota bacterium]